MKKLSIAAITALTISGPALAGANFDSAKFCQDLDELQIISNRWKEEFATSGGDSYVHEFSWHIRTILLTHFGFDEISANYTYHLLKDAYLSGKVSPPWQN